MPAVTADYAVNVLLGYLLGSVPFGLLVGHLWLGRDIRESGSGKTGTTNVLRTAGKIPAVLVMVADIGKGVAPGLLGRYAFDSDGVAAAGAIACVAGHIWPVFAGFRGGRGVATAFGGILGLSPLLSLLFPVVGAALVIPTRYVSLMSVVGTPVCALIIAMLAIAGEQPWAFAWYAAGAVALVEYKHIPNIQRLLAGTEPKIGRGGERKATG